MTRRTGSLTRSLTVGAVDNVAALEAVAAEWDTLAASAAAPPFALPALAIPWWRHLGKGELRLITARSSAGELVGVAPFHRRRRAGIDILRPLGHGLGVVAALPRAEIKADVSRVLLEGLLCSDRRAVVHATDLPLVEPLLMAGRRHSDLAVHAVLHDQCPVIDVAGLSAVGDLLSSPARQRLRKLLSRADRALSTRNVGIEMATQPADVTAAFASLLPLYDAAERDRPRLHLGRGKYRPFFAEAIDALAHREQITILTLIVDGEPAAFDVHVVSGRTAYAILGRFDPRFADVSPGHLLLRAGVQWAIESGLDRIDLQLGGDRYKGLWSTTSYDTLDTVIGTRQLAKSGRAVISASSSAFAVRRRVVSRISDRTP